MHRLPITAAVVVLLGYPAALAADIHQCGGLWTNKPCSGEVSATLSESPERIVSEADRAQSAKRQRLQDLETRRFNARKKYEIELNIDEAREMCGSAAHTVAQCRDACDEADKVLDGRLQLAINAVKAESEKAANTPQPQQVEQNTAVTVIDDRTTIINPPHRQHYRDNDRGYDRDRDRRSRPTAAPNPQPTQIVHGGALFGHRVIERRGR